ncbi:MAG TPA: hypothetical protein VJ729_14360 [Nitrososphaeraceae archaeon]|nr:hypothetical protein [Nitrososphaeraceae archaeon]
MRTPITEDKQKISVFSIAIVIAALAGLMAISITTSALTANAQVPGMTTQQGSTSGGSSGEEEQPDTVTIQKTAESTVDPAPGHSGHQLVMALPPRDDGKVWVGTVTWTASKPVEIVVLQGYNSTVKPDSEHGSPLTAPIGPGKEVAISLVKTSSGTPVPSGSMTFVGNVVGFHTLNGDKFTVTYTLDAVAKQLTQ